MEIGKRKMRPTHALCFLAVFSLFYFPFSIFPVLAAPEKDSWQPVAQALGRTGDEKDGVYRVAFPRTDLRVRVGGVTIRTGLALTSWAAFQTAGDETMVMGDLVLLTTEVSPVVSKLTEGGIEITAIHNHLLGEQPRVMYLHYHGHDDARKLAATLRSALEKTTTPLERPRASDRTGGAFGSGQLFGIDKDLGRRSVNGGGITSYSFPRAEPITCCGRTTLGPRMGVATAINFQSAGIETVTTGDFVLLAGEVQPVIRALRQHGIDVTALHNHMLDEQPRLFFLHFWGRGNAEDLVRGLRAALDATNDVKGTM